MESFGSAVKSEPEHELVIGGHHAEVVVDVEPTKRDLRFWLCIVSLMVPSFLMSFELTGLSTALPVIVADLHGHEFEWVGSAYALSATASQPLMGGLAQVFGRRIVMLLQVLLFAIGSGMCGAANSLNFLIASRTIQGIGAGGIASLTQIIIADLVPLQDRGTFNGIIALAYFFGTSSAPIAAGALAERGQWRWYFYLNVPICALSAALVLGCLKLKVPRGTLKEKLFKLDWAGNFLVMIGTTLVILGLTWGGIRYPWSSWQVLVPLLLGSVSLGAFIIYEAKVPKMPLVPLQVMSNRTSVSGYIQAFFTNICCLGSIYYLPVYYQACRLEAPLRSGVTTLPIGFTVMPVGLIFGVSVAKSGSYRPQLWLAWVSIIVGSALLSTLKDDSSLAIGIVYQIIMGFGLGILMTICFFPVVAPLPVSLNAHALSFFMFVRYFSQVWGVTIGGTVIQNELQKKLPAEFLQQFPSGTSVAYSIIPIIRTLEDPFRSQVRAAFADSLHTYWLVLMSTGAAGLVVSLTMKALPLHTAMDEKWGFEERADGIAREEAIELPTNTEESCEA